MQGGLILVVADEDAIRDLLADVLFGEGYAVALAANGMEASRVMEHRLPSLIVLDLDMPILNGFGFVQSLVERGIVVPVIVMSAATDLAKHARDVGAAGFIAKPYEIAHLLAVVARHYRAA